MESFSNKYIPESELDYDWNEYTLFSVSFAVIATPHRNSLEVSVIQGSLDAFVTEVTQVIFAAVLTDDAIDCLGDHPYAIVGVAMKLTVVVTSNLLV